MSLMFKSKKSVFPQLGAYEIFYLNRINRSALLIQLSSQAYSEANKNRQFSFKRKLVFRGQRIPEKGNTPQKGIKYDVTRKPFVGKIT